MEKERKQGISGGVLCLIIVLCLLLGLASGYILHDKLSNEDNKKIKQNVTEQKDEKTQSTISNNENKEELSQEPNNNKDDVLELTELCKNQDNCQKDFTLNNNEKTINFTYSTYKLNNYLGNVIKLNDKNNVVSLMPNNIDNEYHKATKIALLKNNIIVIEYEELSHYNNLSYHFIREYFNSNGQELTKIMSIEPKNIYDENDKSDIRNNDIIDTTVSYTDIYTSECKSDYDTKKLYRYKLTLISENEFKKEIIDYKEKSCSAQS